jgi:hypothetical protein
MRLFFALEIKQLHPLMEFSRDTAATQAARLRSNVLPATVLPHES